MTRITTHEGAVYGLAAQRHWLATAGEGGEVVLVDLRNGSSRVVLRAEADGWDHVHRLTFAGDRLHWASTGGQVGSLDVGDEAPTMPLSSGTSEFTEALQECLCDLAVGADGSRVLSGGEAGGVICYVPSSGERSLGETAKWPYALAISPLGDRLAVGTWDGMLHVAPLDALDQLEANELVVGPIMPCYAVVWLSDEVVVAAGPDNGGGATVWAVGTDGVPRWSWSGGEEALCLTRYGGGVAVGTASGRVVVLGADGSLLSTHPPLADAPGEAAPYPATAEYTDVPSQAVCSIGASEAGLFAGLAGGAVVAVIRA